MASDGADVGRMRAGLRRWVAAPAHRTGARVRSASPTMFLAALCASAVTPVVVAAGVTGTVMGAGLNVLGSIGGNVLAGVVWETLRDLRRPDDEDEVERALTRRIAEALEREDARAEALRAELAAVLRETSALDTALMAAVETGNQELLGWLTESFTALGSQVHGFGFLLADVQDGLAGIRETLGRQDAEHRHDRERVGALLAQVHLLREEIGALGRRGPATGGPGQRHGGSPYRSRYHRQVRRIAPPRLLDRDAELAELAEFCASPATAGTYAWWRADAWSGKSALMSWFVLHPPAGVRIVSFFVTARLASQNDRAAFIDNLLEQLHALLGQGPPPFLTESTRESYLGELLSEAAEACRARGEQFVLLVDGLDEDRGVHDGPDAYSIAALLPDEPEAGMRVIVAGRPNPPVPADVPAHHPLRDDSIVRTLAASPRAQAIRVEMERDLQRLIRGTVLEQDLLGLVTAAGDGLSAADLEELTGGSRWEVGNLMRTVTGRSFSAREGHFQPDGPELYLLGHESLQVTALEMLGPSRLAGYRDRLHAWARRYGEDGWPVGTPEYLLRGYFRMLQATSDVDKMVACATDPARQDRMLDLSGGDSAALSEIAAVQDVIAAEDDPDLIAMMRVAIHRDHLRDRNSRMPIDLPAVWVTLGRPQRGLSLARSISGSDERIWALRAVATALAAGGDRDEAIETLAEAAAVAAALPDQGARGIRLTHVVDTMVEIDEVNRAEVLARSITDPHEECAALASVVAALVRVGELGRATELAAHAEAMARTTAAPDRWTDSPRRDSALTAAAEAMLDVGNRDRAVELLVQAEAMTPVEAMEITSVTRLWVRLGEHDRAEALARLDYTSHSTLASVAHAMAETGELDRARALARTMAPSDSRDWVLREVVAHLIDAGDLGDAESLAGTLTGLSSRCRALLAVAAAMVTAREPGRATRLIDRIEPDIHSIADAGLRSVALTSAAVALSAAGVPDRADELIDRAAAHADSASGPYWVTWMARDLADAGETRRATILLRRSEDKARAMRWEHRETEKVTSLARALAEAGDFDRAEALCRTLTSPYQQGEALTAVVPAMVEAGEADRAEAVARSVEGSGAPAAAATAMAEAGEFDRAEALAGTLVDAYTEPVVLTAVVTALLGAGHRGRATGLAARLASSMGGFTEASTYETLLRTLVEAGELDCAETVARHLSGLFRPTVARTVQIMAGTGEFDRAEALAGDISGPSDQSTALASVARALADAGEHDRAAELVARAESLARAHPDGVAFIEIAQALAALGRRDRAIDMINEAEALARPSTDRYWVDPSWESVARTLAELGEFDRAEAVAGGISNIYGRDSALKAVACAMARAGDHDRAAATVRRIARPGMHAEAVTAIIEVLVAAREFDRAETLAHDIDNPYEKAKALRILAVSDAPRRTAVTARILVLLPWYTSLDLAIRLVPGVLATVLSETEALSPGVASR